MEALRHGTWEGYLAGCRCALCKATLAEVRRGRELTAAEREELGRQLWRSANRDVCRVRVGGRDMALSLPRMGPSGPVEGTDGAPSGAGKGGSMSLRRAGIEEVPRKKTGGQVNLEFARSTAVEFLEGGMVAAYVEGWPTGISASTRYQYLRRALSEAGALDDVGISVKAGRILVYRKEAVGR